MKELPPVSVPKQPGTELSPKPVLEPQPKVSMAISDLVIKEAKIGHDKKVTCGKMESDVALFLVFEYKATWKFSSFTGILPHIDVNVAVMGNNGAYQSKLDPDKLSPGPEINDHTSSGLLDGETTLTVSNNSTIRLTCETTTKIEPISGDPTHVRVTKTETMTVPQPGKFTLTLTLVENGQQLSKEFVAK